MAVCPCECHGGFQRPCSVQGGCGHLHPEKVQKSPQVALERPANACLLCRPPLGTRSWRRADRGFRTCTDCFDSLRSTLRDIASRYGQLDPSPGGSAGDGTPAPKGFGSKPPANLHVIVMRDPRSSTDAKVWVGGDGRVHTESERPPLSVFGVLDTWAWDVAEQRQFEGHGQATVSGLCIWLDTHLDWITRQELVKDFHTDLRRLLSQLMPATGDSRVWLAKCPNTIDEGKHSRSCDANLYAPTRGNIIKCGACHRGWTREEWGDDKKPGSLAALIRDKRAS